MYREIRDLGTRRSEPCSYQVFPRGFQGDSAHQGQVQGKDAVLRASESARREGDFSRVEGISKGDSRNAASREANRRGKDESTHKSAGRQMSQTTRRIERRMAESEEFRANYTALLEEEKADRARRELVMSVLAAERKRAHI